MREAVVGVRDPDNPGNPGNPGNPNETYISFGTNSTSEHDAVVTYVCKVDVHANKPNSFRYGRHG